MEEIVFTDSVKNAIERMRNWNGGFTRKEMSSVNDTVFNYLANKGIIKKFGTEFYLEIE
jgi:hypothetical protein